MVVHDRLGVNAEGVVDRRQDFDWVDRAFERGGGGGVALAVDVAALEAGASHHGCVAVGPMVAAVGGIAIAGGADALGGAAAEFADGD